MQEAARTARRWAAVALAATAGVATAQSSPPAAGDGNTPRLVAATFLGTAGDDELEGVAIAPDGTIYAAGTAAGPLADLPGGVKPVTLGEPNAAWGYGCGFVARFSADGTRLLAAAQFARGLAKLTTVAVSSAGICVGGYGGQGIEPLLNGTGGLIVKGRYDQRDYKLFTPREHYSEPRCRKQLDQRGVPLVVRLDAALTRLTAGTLLKGWQSVWHVPLPLSEDHWQPTGLALLPDGDVAVSHDGGYATRPGDGRDIGYEQFYFCPDHVSRLSGDLTRRRWKIDVYTPPVDPKRATEVISRIMPSHPGSIFSSPWRHESLGQTRILRLRSDAAGNILLAGWSPGRTSSEPWWTPFLIKLDGRGKTVWRAYSFDPMSGPDGRLGGLVSDAGVRSVAADANGDVLAATIGDGGNNVITRDPRDYTRPAPALRGTTAGFRGRLLFWGTVVRLDGGTRELLGGSHVAARGANGVNPAWAEDVVPLSGGAVLAAGRHAAGLLVTADAWFTTDRTIGPDGKSPAKAAGQDGAGRGFWRRREPCGDSFVRLYDRRFNLRFSTTLPFVELKTAAVRGRRVVVVGTANSPRAPAQKALAACAGGRDGYLLVLDAP